MKNIAKPLFVFLSLLCIITSCSKDNPVAPLGKNPLPGSWEASNVDFFGVPVNFDVTIFNNFQEDLNIYSTDLKYAGEAKAYVGEELFESVQILSCMYNSETYTGQFSVLYSDGREDNPDDIYSILFIYDWQKDAINIVDINFNITFTRK